MAERELLRQWRAKYEAWLRYVPEDKPHFDQWLKDLKAVTRRYDELLDNGEGFVTEDDGASPNLVLNSHVQVTVGEYRWVRVYSDETHSKAIATIYLHYMGGKLVEMRPARARKGLPPNPADLLWSEVAGYMWHGGEGGSYSDTDKRVKPIELGLHGAMRGMTRDMRGSQQTKGARPSLSVDVSLLENGDTVWKLARYSVRGSKLAPVLDRLRRAGVQRVSVQRLQEAVNLYVRNSGRDVL